MLTTLTLLAALAALPHAPALDVEDGLPVVLPLRERAALRDRWLAERLDTLVPALMRRAGIDLWIVTGREYVEDPVLSTMLPATWMSARRRTILVFFDRGARTGVAGVAGAEGAESVTGAEGAEIVAVERLAVSRYDVGPFERAWDPETEPDQWARLAELVAERDPATIAIDTSPTFALADGITASERSALLAALTPELRSRVVGAEPLAIGWLETRTASELDAYPTLCRLAHGIIAEALSERVVQPGHTATEDVEWWMRERVAELRLETWFHPSVSVQRASEVAAAADGSLSFAAPERTRTIERGDLVHVDFGIRYLGLHTDTQQHAYVLRATESEPPAGLRAALAAGNRQQDLLLAEMRAGRTGNEILAAALAAGRAAGLRPTIYTHPLGYHGHGAGPTIGLWDRQDGVPGRGDWPLNASTAYSIELAVDVDVPEWGGSVHVMLEEDAVFDGERVRWLDGRQEELLLIR